MTRKIKLTPEQKTREAKLNALLNQKSNVPPIALKTQPIPDPMALLEAKAEAAAEIRAERRNKRAA